MPGMELIGEGAARQDGGGGTDAPVATQQVFGPARQATATLHLAVLQFGLGESLVCEQRNDKSIRHFERVIATSPNDAFRFSFHLARWLTRHFGSKVVAPASPGSDTVRSASAKLPVPPGRSGARASRACGALLRARPDITGDPAHIRLFDLKRAAQATAPSAPSFSAPSSLPTSPEPRAPHAGALPVGA